MPIVTPIGSVVSGNSSDHSIQGFIELVYVKTANEVLVSQLNSLDQSLSVTASALSLLNQLQTLHNAVKVNDRTIPSFAAGITAASYKALASALFGKALSVVPDYSDYSGSSTKFYSALTNIKVQISGILSSLSAITPALAGGGVDSNSLLAKLKQVLTDINSSGSGSAWLVDRYNSATSSTSQGLYQQNITNAITAAQSLNTTQTTAVRNFLQIYEEYYKSASAVLTAISQMIQKIAGGIAR